MIRFAILLTVAFASVTRAQDASPDDDYLNEIAEVRLKYRIAIAKKIRSAKRVELFILRFDDVKQNNELAEKDVDKPRFPIRPNGDATTSILSSKRLNAVDCQELLQVLADRLEMPSHTGGAFCHYPVHGLRVYSGNKSDKPLPNDVLLECSFCWACENFGFEYPDKTNQWLDTDEKLQAIFNRLLPIPDEETKRFNKPIRRKPKDQRVKRDAKPN